MFWEIDGKIPTNELVTKTEAQWTMPMLWYSLAWIPCVFRVFWEIDGTIPTKLATKTEAQWTIPMLPCCLLRCSAFSKIPLADHLTLEGWDGGWLISGHQYFFFLAIWWAGYFFPFFSHKLSITFVLHAGEFFFSDKCLQEMFLKITHPPSLRS